MQETSSKTLLIGDIGGTNARFALANPDGVAFSEPRTLQCAEFSNSVAAMKQYLDDVAAPAPDAVCLAAAGPVIDESIKVTNNHWNLSAAEIRGDLGVERVRLLNDFEAVAWSIPYIDSHLSLIHI